MFLCLDYITKIKKALSRLINKSIWCRGRESHSPLGRLNTRAALKAGAFIGARLRLMTCLAAARSTLQNKKPQLRSYLVPRERVELS